jgi:peptidoglycan/xylan/chitin deacetylase (PgdA/CDA1 family)
VSEILVLCYHAVSERWKADLAVTPGALRRQVELLLGRGYVPATFGAAVAAAPATRTLAITFDDAFRSVFELAFPLLSELGAPATVFVPTQHVDSGRPMAWPGIDQWLGGPHEQELVGMSWNDVATLAGAGWEIGSHTRTHPRLTQLDDAELARELAGSRHDCEAQLAIPCLSLAYPYGDVDARVAAAAAGAGYHAAAELSRRLRGGRALRWPRVGVYSADGEIRFRLKTGRALRRVRALGSVVPGR